MWGEGRRGHSVLLEYLCIHSLGTEYLWGIYDMPRAMVTNTGEEKTRTDDI